jgi:hypothetical protein
VAWAPNITTTPISVTSERTKQQLVVTDKSEKIIDQNFVTDASYNFYIAERTVAFYGYGLRPNQKLHAFFDKILVDQYCTPGIIPTEIPNTSDYKSIQKNGNEGDSIVTNAAGIVAGWFRIPAGIFKTGDRVFELADADNLVSGTDAISTSASATFTASTLNVTKQHVTLTTVNPELSWQEIKPARAADGSLIDSDAVKVEKGIVDPTLNISVRIGEVRGTWCEPIAQGLTINTPGGEPGIFATSIDIFFKQKSKNVQNGVTVYICETLNGYPNGDKVIPYSMVHLPWANVAINNNGVASYSLTTSTSDAYKPRTNFKFPSPVFLNNNTEYAFVVKPDAGDPDYWTYSGILGDTDPVAKYQMSSQPVLGTAFYGATDKQWTALQNEYITFGLWRANFTQRTGQAAFKNEPRDFISIYNVGSTETKNVQAGDYVFKATSSDPATACTTVYAIVEGYDEVKNLIYAADSPGSFAADSYVQVHRFANTTLVTTPGPNSSTIVAWGNTGAIHDVKLDMLVPQVATISPAGTSLSFKYSGTSNTYVKDSDSYPVNVGTENEFFDKERIVASRTNEIAHMSSNSSFRMYANLVTDSELVSPVVDLVKNKQLVLQNDIDPVTFIYDEFFNNGASKTKYISKVVTLAEGQDAEDIQVLIDAFRPVDSDIQVWVKFLNGEDQDNMTDKTWTPMFNTGSYAFSTPNNPNDIKEYVFTVPKFYGMIPLSGTITSTSACTTIVGVNTKFTTELEVGWYINMLSTTSNQEISKRVVSIVDDTHLVIDNDSALTGVVGFRVNYTAQPYFLVPPPTTPWLSTDTTLKLSGLVSTSITNNTITGLASQFNANTQVGNSTEAITITNANTYYTVNDRVYYYVPTGNTAVGGLTGNTFYYIQASNTTTIKLTDVPGGSVLNLTASALTETHSINSTNFTGELTPGSEIKINGDMQAVVSIANGISLTVGKPWTSAVTNYPGYVTAPNGLSYLNKSDSLYTSFKQFQIKVILQSNDSSRVPMVKNIRGLALQL